MRWLKSWRRLTIGLAVLALGSAAFAHARRAPVVTRAGDAPPRLTYRTKTLTSGNQVRTEILSCERQMQEMSDLSALTRLRLQQAMQEQTQAFQIISNIMKNMHDTAKAIIQNMR